MTDFLIRLRNVQVSLGGRIILGDINWDLKPLEQWAISGPNGAGKSTFLRLLRGEVRPALGNPAPANPTLADATRLDRSPVCLWAFDGKPDASPLAVRPISSILSPEMQRHYVRQAWKLSGEEIILSAFGDGYLPYSAPENRELELCYETAKAVGAEYLLETDATEMSQGQLRLILLARALVKKPRLLLLDEASDGLDASARRLFFAALEKIASENCSVVHVSHRGRDLPPFITHSMQILDGRIQNAGPSLPSGAPIQNAGSPDQANVPHARPAGKTPPEKRPIFAFAKASVYLAGKKVLHELDWQVNESENWLISGPNGSGKSTLLRLLQGLEQTALGGSLTWYDNNGRPFKPTLEERRHFTGVVSDRLQNEYQYELSGFEVILSGLRGTIGLYGGATPREEARVREVLRLFDLTRQQDTLNTRMSEGTARRFLLARAIAPTPRLLLLDEPCSGLDTEARAAFLRNLFTAVSQGSRLIFVSHSQDDLNDMAPLITHELKLSQGRRLA